MTSVPECEEELRLAPESIEAIARRVAELLARDGRPARPGRLMTAAEVSDWWGVERSWIYAHADELGARRLGSGQRPRLRFDADEVGERLAALAQSGERAGSLAMAPDSRSTRFRRRAELSSPRNRNRPGGAATPPATAPKNRPSAR